MPAPRPDPSTEAFERCRPRLARLAYRMLGSTAEADDVVQDAFLRWREVDPAAVREPEAYLMRTVARLCLDQLKSARARREQYVGPWLPEPIIDPVAEAEAERADEVTLGLMVALERLSPRERAAFLLHDVFDMPFEEVAGAIGRDPAACRQLASRARAHVRAERPRYRVSPEEGQAIARAFFRAVQLGDVAQLQSLLASDVVHYADGGGKRAATLNPIHGRDKVVRMFEGFARKLRSADARWVCGATIDGLPGFIAYDPDGFLQTTALEVEDGRITAIYAVRNPDKLRAVEALVEHRNAADQA